MHCKAEEETLLSFAGQVKKTYNITMTWPNKESRFNPNAIVEFTGNNLDINRLIEECFFYTVEFEPPRLSEYKHINYECSALKQFKDMIYHINHQTSNSELRLEISISGKEEWEDEMHWNVARSFAKALEEEYNLTEKSFLWKDISYGNFGYGDILANINDKESIKKYSAKADTDSIKQIMEELDKKMKDIREYGHKGDYDALHHAWGMLKKEVFLREFQDWGRENSGDGLLAQ
jgi:hypothetical protein